MNIWLNPKYSQTMAVHAGKLLSLIDMENLQRLSRKGVGLSNPKKFAPHRG